MNQHRQTQVERVYEILADGRWHSTLEIEQKTGIAYPPRRIYDLKRKGYTILSRPSTDGSRWEEYRLGVGPLSNVPLSATFRELQAIKDKDRLEREAKSKKKIKVETMPTLWAYDNSRPQR